MTAVEIPARLSAARRSGRWWSGRCPVQDEHSPSLSVRGVDFGIIVRWPSPDPRGVLSGLRGRVLTTATSVPIAISLPAQVRPT
jgi:hypothetical protein